MKAIMINEAPLSCVNTMNGDKTILVRKENVGKAVQKLIDEQGFADIYVRCTKDEYLLRTNKGYIATKKPLTVGKDTEYTFAYSEEGKVLFKFRCYKVDKITCLKEWGLYSYYPDILHKTCLTEKEMFKYLDSKTGYAIHISDLEIFDKPKELSEFYKVGFDKALKESLKSKPYPLSITCIETQYQLTKAPQSFCYVEVENV